MGLFDIFTNQQKTNATVPGPAAPAVTPPPGAPVATPIPPGNIPPPAIPAIPGQGVVPVSAVQVPTEPAEPESPLDAFKDLWEPVPVDPNTPVPKPAEPITAEQIQTAVAKADFAKGITPEQLTAITAGGEGATAAFAQAMNAVAQQVMVQSTLVNNRLTEKAVAEAVAKQQADIPDMLRKQQSTAHLNDTSELFSNSAIMPVVKATQAQLLQKFPNATPAEITKMTQDFITVMGEQFAPKPPADPNEQDWSNFA